MTKEEITKNNKLIASFMGRTFDLYAEEKGKYGITITGCQYHSSWDWLMPVVKKISKIPDGDGYSFKRSLDGGLFYDISDVYEYVINFIKWYNQKNNNE